MHIGSRVVRGGHERPHPQTCALISDGPDIVRRDCAPKLVVDKDVIDFGAVPYRKMIEARFEISNAGKEVLEVTEAPFIEIVKGCCPPSPVLGKKSLKPGERTTVSVSFMMYQGMGGLHDFRVHLRTNDPSQPDKTVQILSDWK